MSCSESIAFEESRFPSSKFIVIYMSDFTSCRNTSNRCSGRINAHNWFQWKSDNNLHEIKVMRRYHIQKREDYTKYNPYHLSPVRVAKHIYHALVRYVLCIIRYLKLGNNIQSLANRISLLDARDPKRPQMEEALLGKLYNMGLITAKTKFSDARKITVSAFCRCVETILADVCFC